MLVVFSLFLLQLLQLPSVETCPSLEFHVNTSSCHQPCTYCTLDEAMQLANNCSEEPIKIILDSNVTFTDKQIEIKGQEDREPVTILCGNNTGLSFMGVENLTISNVHFRGCGMYHHDYQTWFALRIENTSSLQISNILVDNSPGIGLGLINVQKTAEIVDSNFSSNGVGLSQGMSGGGLGMFVLQQTGNASYLITECRFFDHHMNISSDERYIWENDAYGAGIYVNISKDAKFVDFVFSDNEVSNNSALHGAGMAIVFTGCIQDINIEINNTIFRLNNAETFIIENGVTKPGNGGGLLVAYLTKSLEEAKVIDNISVQINNCLFEDNTAGVGGGLHVMGSRSKLVESNNCITVNNCNWTNNIADVGAAVQFSRNYYDIISRGNLPQVNFSDCSFSSNKNRGIGQREFHSQDLKWVGVGVFFSEYFDITFLGQVLFVENNGSAIGAIDTVITFQCNARFISNSGYYGGAISLMDLSDFSFNSGTDILFANNTATGHGGAIYSHIHGKNTPELLSAASCPFRQYATFKDPSAWNVTLTFTNNTAARGKSIYMTSLDPCQIAFSQTGIKIKAEYVFSNFSSTFVFHDDDKQNQIATAGSKYDTTSPLTCAIPGKEYHLPIKFLDEIGQQVNDLFFQVISETPDIIQPTESSFCISNNTLTMNGKLGENGNLRIQTVGLPSLSFEINVPICNDCPPGYTSHEVPNATSSEIITCKCDVENYVGLVNCDPSVQVKRGTWVGYINNTLVTADCPLWYCDYNTSAPTYPLPAYNGSENYTITLQKFICSENREGNLCGKCVDDKTVFCCSEANHCQDNHLCEIGWLFFILSTILPVTLTFLFITGFGINLTTGYLRGFLLFCQILLSMNIQMGGIVILPGPVETLNNIWKFIYDIFRLRFFHNGVFAYCLFPGATALDLLLIQYISTIYAFLMILAVVLLFDRCALKCSGLRRRVKFSTAKQSVVNGMSALLILSYGNCTDATFRLLNFSTVNSVNKTTLPNRYVCLDGEIEFLSKEHLPYAIPAILTLFTVVLPPLIVFLVCPLLHKVLAFFHLDDTRLAKVFSFCYLGGRMKPFYDVFFSCFKDKFNFFAGMYFLYQILGMAPQIFGRSERSILMTNALLVVMLMIHSIVQPYHNRVHNFIDALLFTDLILITSMSSVNRIGFLFPDLLISVDIVSVVQTLLYSMPLFVVISALAIHCVLKCFVRPRIVPTTQISRSGTNNREEERQALLNHEDSRERSLGSFIAWAQTNPQATTP